MVTMYVYEIDSLEIVAVVTGEMEQDCIVAVECAYDWDTYGSQFSARGLVQTSGAEQIAA